jgi:hypothetical protein
VKARKKEIKKRFSGSAVHGSTVHGWEEGGERNVKCKTGDEK